MLIACGLVEACGGANRSWSASDVPPPPSSGNLVTGTELSRFSPNETLLTALQRLRPRFLHSRGTTPAVVIDGAPAVDLSVLDNFLTSTIFDVRLVRASTVYSAVTSDGRVVVGDVLLVRTRR